MELRYLRSITVGANWYYDVYSCPCGKGTVEEHHYNFDFVWSDCWIMCPECSASYGKRMLKPDKWEIYNILDSTKLDLSGQKDKRRLEVSGLWIKDGVTVRCDTCGELHVFQADAFMDEPYDQNSHMGIRTEHKFVAEEVCDGCGSPLCCSVALSEYPPGTIEGIPKCECKGCSENNPHIEVEFNDYSLLLDNPYIVDLYIPHDEESVIWRPEIVVDGGVAKLFTEDNHIYTGSKLIVPVYGELFDILTTETGTIVFDSVGPRLIHSLVERSPKGQAMTVLGSVAEAIIVHKCAMSDEANKKWLDLARRGRSWMDTVRRFTAIGTGLNSTQNKHRRKYDKGNPQRDIIWIDEHENEALMVGGSTVAGLVAGLQVKTSTNGVGYVQPNIVSGKYEVPVVYFPINDDFDQIVRNLDKKVAKGEMKPVEIGKDFIDGRREDWETYIALKEYYSILEALYSGKMTPKEFVDKATGVVPLENAIMAHTLKEGASKLLLVG